MDEFLEHGFAAHERHSQVEPHYVEEPQDKTRPCRSIETKLDPNRFGGDAADHIFAVARGCDAESLVAGERFRQKETQNSHEQSNAKCLQQAAGQRAGYSAHRIASRR
jgi:hypothetical protein